MTAIYTYKDNAHKSADHLHQESRITYLSEQLAEAREEVNRLQKRRDEAIRDCFVRGTSPGDLGRLSGMSTNRIFSITKDIRDGRE